MYLAILLTKNSALTLLPDDRQKDFISLVFRSVGVSRFGWVRAREAASVPSPSAVSKPSSQRSWLRHQGLAQSLFAEFVPPKPMERTKT